MKLTIIEDCWPFLPSLCTLNCTTAKTTLHFYLLIVNIDTNIALSIEIPTRERYHSIISNERSAHRKENTSFSNCLVSF